MIRTRQKVDVKRIEVKLSFINDLLRQAVSKTTPVLTFSTTATHTVLIQSPIDAELRAMQKLLTTILNDLENLND